MRAAPYSDGAARARHSGPGHGYQQSWASWGEASGKRSEWRTSSTTTVPTSASSSTARRRARLWQPGACARPVRCASGSQRPGRGLRRLPQPGQRGQQGLRVVTRPKACEEADLIANPGTGPPPAGAARRGHRAEPGGQGRALLRARAEHPLPAHRPARGRGRVHGGPKGSRTPGPPPSLRGSRRAGARRGGAGRHRERVAAHPLLRPRRSAAPGGRAGHHVQGGDGTGPVRRAGRVCRWWRSPSSSRPGSTTSSRRAPPWPRSLRQVPARG